MDKFLKCNKIELRNAIERDVWIFQTVQARDFFAKIYKLWSIAKTDDEKQSVGELLRTEKCNLWSIDPSEKGIIRKFIIGDDESKTILDEIVSFNNSMIGARIKPLSVTGDLPMTQEAAWIRLKDEYHLGQPVDVLMADIRATGMLALSNPGYDNLSEIPKLINDAMPNATDRQKLTLTTTVELSVNEKKYTYIIVAKNVLKIIKHINAQQGDASDPASPAR